MSFFTIIIPTYNSGKTLSAALTSISGQTFQNFEVLVMDGQSQDDTLTIVSLFQEKLSQLYVHSEKDESIYEAMNKGMDKAVGGWLFFMGSDDVFYDEYVLEKVSQFLETTQTKVVYGNAKIIGDTGWANDGTIYNGVFTLNKLLNQNICHQAIFYNTSFIKHEVGYFNTRYLQCSDWDFNLRCWSHQPFAYIDLIVSNFMSGGVSTNSYDREFFNDYVSNLLGYFKITPFHKLINNKHFICFNDVVTIQQSKYPMTFKLLQLKRKIKKTLNIT